MADGEYVTRLYSPTIIQNVKKSLARYQSMLGANDYNALKNTLDAYSGSDRITQNDEREMIASLDSAIDALADSTKVYSSFVAHEIRSWLPQEANTITTTNPVFLCTTNSTDGALLGNTIMDFPPVALMRKSVYEAEVKSCIVAATSAFELGESFYYAFAASCSAASLESLVPGQTVIFDPLNSWSVCNHLSDLGA